MKVIPRHASSSDEDCSATGIGVQGMSGSGDEDHRPSGAGVKEFRFSGEVPRQVSVFKRVWRNSDEQNPQHEWGFPRIGV